MLSAVFARWRRPPMADGADGAAGAEAELPPFVIASPAAVRLSIGEGGTPVLRCGMEALPAQMPEMTPGWLSQCVVDGQFHPRDSMKVSFHLLPHPVRAAGPP